MPQPLVITIDGPAGAGKSSVAKAIARRLNIFYLDTGAMYRALTLKALRKKINLADEDALAAMARQTTIEFRRDKEGALRIFLDGEDVSQEIRSLEVTNNTFYAARTAKVRSVLVKWQQAMGQKESIVGEGRDLGTVVFPRADYKFYLDADFEERCRRRIKELKEQGKSFDEEQLKKDIQERDQKDFTRQASPLRKADDAIVIDSTGLTAEETAEVIIKHIKASTRV